MVFPNKDFQVDEAIWILEFPGKAIFCVFNILIFNIIVVKGKIYYQKAGIGIPDVSICPDFQPVTARNRFVLITGLHLCESKASLDR